MKNTGLNRTFILNHSDQKYSNNNTTSKLHCECCMLKSSDKNFFKRVCLSNLNNMNNAQFNQIIEHTQKNELSRYQDLETDNQNKIYNAVKKYKFQSIKTHSFCDEKYSPISAQTPTENIYPITPLHSSVSNDFLILKLHVKTKT